jgi:hypothetical protein
MASTKEDFTVVKKVTRTPLTQDEKDLKAREQRVDDIRSMRDIADAYGAMAKKSKDGSITLGNDNYDAYFAVNKAKAEAIVKTVDKFIINMCKSFQTEMIRAAQNGERYVMLFTYNDNPERGDLRNHQVKNTVRDALPEYFDTKYIMAGWWQQFVKKYVKLSIKTASVEERVKAYINDKRFGGGIDIVTGQPYHVSVFWYKKSDSHFANGVLVSRNGINYTGAAPSKKRTN